MRTYLFAGALSGIAFGAAEAVAYTASYTNSYDTSSGPVAVIVWRLLSDSLLDAVFAGICAFFVGLAARYRDSAWKLMLAGLGLTAVLHGAYDAWSNGWLGTVVAALSVFIFAG